MIVAHAMALGRRGRSFSEEVSIGKCVIEMVESSRLERVAVVCFERDTRGSNKSSSGIFCCSAHAESVGSELGRDFLPAHKSFNTSLIVLKHIVSLKYIKVKELEAEVVGELPICALVPT
jgi:hypothetical protein